MKFGLYVLMNLVEDHPGLKEASRNERMVVEVDLAVWAVLLMVPS